MLPTLTELESAAAIIYRVMPPTPQYSWASLNQRLGAEVWIKHENHTPVGAFKVRGGLVLLDELNRTRVSAPIAGIVTATRGNHGQSIAFAARRYAVPVVVVVPEGNSVEKNAAMRALGVELVIHGHDFQAASEHAQKLSEERGLYRVPSFHPFLVRGVGTYALEFLRAVPDLDTVYVPIGLGSGICGMIAARQVLNLRIKIVGVVLAGAPAYARSLASKTLVSHDVTTQLADGMACRTPVAEALEIIYSHIERIIEVTDEEVATAMGVLFTDTHNVAEGAGAAGLAALMKEQESMRGRKVGTVLCGGNVDADVFARVLQNTI
ncbi:MAG: threonine dehydratase [Acidobacteriota bacterium]|nr:threonine dehydratase [Acidobacteriota bacterium]